MTDIQKQRSLPRKLLRWILGILCLIVIAAAGLIGYLTLTEYKPAEVEALEIVQGAAEDTVSGTLKIMTWNIGYGALGDNADFFMDGGSHVMTASEERVRTNLENVIDTIQSVDADVVFLQELDRDSARSYHIDELEQIASALPETDYLFAYNFKVPFIPYPVPPIGKVESGIATFSKYSLENGERIKLPNPFSWPIRIANLKRCLEISRIDLDDEAGRQLVLVNLHLEAYDSGEGKIAQTKMLADVLQAEADKGNYVIAGGDFNQIFSGADASAWPQQEGMWAPGELDTSQFADGWQFIMDASAPTCRSLDQPLEGADEETFQFYLIDGFIVSENIRVISAETMQCGFVSSDHNPVVMEVELIGTAE